MLVAAPARHEPAVSTPRALRLLERAQPLHRAPVRPSSWYTRLGRWVDRLLLA